MKGYIKLFAGLLFLTCFYSCEKDFILDDPDQPSKLVVNCELNNGQPIRLYLSSSISPYSNTGLHAVDNAEVEIYKNDSLLQTLPFAFSDSAHTFGSYQSDAIAEAGNEYSFEIKHPSYATVFTRDSVPLAPQVSSYQLVQYGNSGNDYQSLFRFRLADNGASEDFYRVNVWQWGQYIFSTEHGDTILKDFVVATRPQFNEPLSDTVHEFNTYLLFSDKTFNGQSKELNMKFEGLELYKTVKGYLSVEISRVSKAHFAYYQSLEKFRQNAQSSDAVPVFSNVSGGYGILMSRSLNNMTVQIK